MEKIWYQNDPSHDNPLRNIDFFFTFLKTWLIFCSNPEYTFGHIKVYETLKHSFFGKTSYDRARNAFFKFCPQLGLTQRTAMFSKKKIIFRG